MQIDKRSRAEKAYVRSNKTMTEVADEFGVSVRTVERWAKDDDWKGKRAKYFKVSVTEPHIAIGRTSVRIDYNQMIHDALSDLADAAKLAEPKSLESILSVRLAYLKFARQYEPLTVKELAEMAIANGIDFDAVMAELANHNEQKNAG